MADCPNCESEHVYTQLDDEWEYDGSSNNGYSQAIKWACENCPECGWQSEPFVWDTKVIHDDLNYGLWDG